MSDQNRIVVGHVTPLVEYSPIERQRRAAELIREAKLAGMLTTDEAREVLAEPVPPEQQWRPYEPCKEEA